MTTANNRIGELFSTAGQTTTGGVNQLGKTAQLTSMSEQIARNVMDAVNADLEKFQPLVVESQKSHDAMDKLIAEAYDLSTVDVEFLKTEDDDTLEKMIRSQQSKRSRAKSKVMTLENYNVMLTGAVAENLLRIASGKPKSAGGGSYIVTDVGYSEEELQKLAADPESLKKAIRNIQSKKSIAKSKADFDETSERWQALLATEEQLKSLRSGVDTAAVTKAVETQSKIEEMLASVDAEQLKGNDAKGILQSIKEMLAGK